LAQWPLSIDTDEVLVEGIGAPLLFAGHSSDGSRWLVAQIAETVDGQRWLCAPVSEVAIGCVLSGVAEPADVFRHSATGTVEDITVNLDGRVSESTRLCKDVNVVPLADLVCRDRCA
jgi:hypothetical protein